MLGFCVAILGALTVASALAPQTPLFPLRSLDPVGSYSLNTGREFAAHKNEEWVSPNELIQNLYDQAQLMCNFTGVNAQLIQQADGQSNDTTWDIHCKHENQQRVATLSVSATSESSINMRLVKCDTELSFDAFMHGESTKKHNGNFVGHFGDDLKISLARLLAKGVEVNIYTGRDVRVAEYKVVEEGSLSESLFITSYKLTEPTPDLVIQLNNLSTDAFDVNRYAFIQTASRHLFWTPGIGTIIDGESNR